MRRPGEEQVQRPCGENELVMLMGQQEGQNGRRAKGTLSGLTSVRKVIRAQMKGSPEDHNMMMSSMCNRISKTEGPGPNLDPHLQYDREQRHTDSLKSHGHS